MHAASLQGLKSRQNRLLQRELETGALVFIIGLAYVVDGFDGGTVKVCEWRTVCERRTVCELSPRPGPAGPVEPFPSSRHVCLHWYFESTYVPGVWRGPRFLC